MKTMKIEIRREHITRYGIDGRLFVDGVYVCDTAESVTHHLCMGRFDVTVEHNKHVGRKVIMLKAQREGACDGMSKGFIAFGNGLHGFVDNRIYVGMHRVSGLLTQSFATFLTLYNRVNKAVSRGTRVELAVS